MGMYEEICKRCRQVFFTPEQFKCHVCVAALAASGTEAAPSLLDALNELRIRLCEIGRKAHASTRALAKQTAREIEKILAAASPEREGREALLPINYVGAVDMAYSMLHSIMECCKCFACSRQAKSIRDILNPLRQSAAPSGGRETHNELEIVKRVLAWHQTGYALFHNTEGHGVHESHNMAIGWASVELAKWLAQESKTGAVTERRDGK